MPAKPFFFKEDTRPVRRRRLVEGRKKSVEEKEKRQRSATKTFDCEACGLYKGVKSPKMKPYGQFKKKVLAQAEAPGEEEDRDGVPFNPKAPAGGLFRPYFRKYGLDMEVDCLTINSLDCRPMEGDRNRKPTKMEIRCCHSRKLEVYEKWRPEVVLLVGEPALESFYDLDVDRPNALSLASMRAKVIPDKRLDAWVCHIYHPSFILRGNQDLEHVFGLDFAVFASMVGKPRPSFNLYENEIKILSTYDEVMDFLGDEWHDPFLFDYETSSYRYYEAIHTIHMIGVSFTGRSAYVFPYDFKKMDGRKWFTPLQMKQIAKCWREKLRGKCPKSAQNLKHEALASQAGFGVEVRNWDWDPMVASHVLDEAKKVTSLKKQVYIKWGYDYGGEEKKFLEAPLKQRNEFEKMAVEKSGLYCGRDAMFGQRLVKQQKRVMKVEGLMGAYRLLHEGVIAFSKMEQEGIRIDVKQAKAWDKEWGEEIESLKAKIMDSPEAKLFEAEVGRKPNYKKKFSSKDLQTVLFEILKLKPKRKTKTGFAVDEETLSEYADKCIMLKDELRVRKVEKRKNTYLSQFLRLHVDGFIYPSFHLHVARSYRSSSSDPNFQNLPKKDEESALIRKLIIPRNGNKLMCGDYSSMEVRILACASKDKRLIDYVVSGADPHSDWAVEIVGPDALEDKEWDWRDITKNTFIFPEFYGSWYKSIAKGFPIPEDFYPTTTKLRRYERWESHLGRCERKFWKEFKGVREWQDSKYEQYKRVGYVQDDAWGFRRRGYLTRNKIYNFPIQGPAFHCLLWSIIRYYKEKYDQRFESKLCAQIHDELFFDAEPGEVKELREKVSKIMTEDIREEHPWIIVPLEVEWSMGDNWLEMKGVE